VWALIAQRLQESFVLVLERGMTSRFLILAGLVSLLEEASRCVTELIFINVLEKKGEKSWSSRSLAVRDTLPSVCVCVNAWALPLPEM
jgi:hypothetical protein